MSDFHDEVYFWKIFTWMEELFFAPHLLLLGGIDF